MPSTPAKQRVPRPSTAPGHWLYLGHLATIWGIALSNILHALLAIWLAWAWWTPARQRLRWRWPLVASLMVPLLVWVIFSLVSVLFSFDPRVSAGEMKELLAITTLPLGLLLVRGEQGVRRVYDLLLAMIAVLAVYGISQYYFTDFGALHNRIRGPFSHYQTYAGVLLVGDLLLVARLATRGGWRRPWLWALLAVFSWALMLSLTRGSWVAAAVTPTIYLLLRARRYVVLYLSAAALLLILAPDSWLQRIDSIRDLRDPSNYDRLCMVEAGLYMIGERPFYGIGPGMVEERYPIYRHPSAPQYTVPHLHNALLQTAAERGLFSLGAYLWLIVAAFMLAFRAYRREGGPGGERADLYLGVMMVLIGFHLAGLFEDNWSDTEIQRLVLFLLAVPGCLRLGDALQPSTEPTEAPAAAPSPRGA